MHRCLQLALLGAGYVAPNPMVGAVLVHEGRIIGEGWHRQWGGPHAEVHCLESVAEEDRRLIERSTLYVSLEPCNHTGKTGPCTELILRNRIPEVVLAMADPFPRVNGSGIARLREAGVRVITGVMEKEARFLNRRFLTFHRAGRPYVILKWAESGNGMIAGPGGKPVRITGSVSDRLVHRWRSEEAAIMVGTQTAINDNPLLSTRLWPGKSPVPVLIDQQLRVNEKSALYSSGNGLIVINGKRQDDSDGIRYRVSASAEPSAYLDTLFNENLQSVIVEGGASVLRSFIASGIWDEARVLVNRRMIIPDGIPAPRMQDASLLESMKVGTDECFVYLREVTVQGNG